MSVPNPGMTGARQVRQLSRWADLTRRSIRLYRNWPAAVTDKWRLRGQLRLYRLRPSAGGARLLATAWSDTRIVNELWLRDPYLRELPAGEIPRVIVDVGANRGYFAVQCAQRFPGAVIIAFEPEPRNLRLLAANIAINEVEVDARAEALVPDDRTTVRLYEAIHPAFHTTVAPADAEAAGLPAGRFTGGELDVPARNVDDVLTELVTEHGDIDVLKIDTEGTELALLAALSDATLARIRYAAVEISTVPDAELVTRLEAAGFEVNVQLPYLIMTKLER